MNRWKVLEATLALAANLARDILNNTATSDEEEKQDIADQHQINAPGAVINETTIEASDLPEMEGTKESLNVEETELPTPAEIETSMLENKIKAAGDLSIFLPLQVEIIDDAIMVDGMPLEKCDAETIAMLQEKV